MMQRLVHTIPQASELANQGRTSIYEAINRGELHAVKRGRRTLILHDELVRYVQSLPALLAKKSSTARAEADLGTASVEVSATGRDNGGVSKT
jgi:excisionase family DNA binding protein